MSARKKYGKAKWISTRLSKEYRSSVAGARLFMCAGIAASLGQAASRIGAVRSFRDGTPIDGVAKNIRIAEICVGAMRSASIHAREGKESVQRIKSSYGVVK